MESISSMALCNAVHRFLKAEGSLIKARKRTKEPDFAEILQLAQSRYDGRKNAMRLASLRVQKELDPFGFEIGVDAFTIPTKEVK